MSLKRYLVDLKPLNIKERYDVCEKFKQHFFIAEQILDSNRELVFAEVFMEENTSPDAIYTIVPKKCSYKPL